jgi:hypothetical protein
MTNLWVTPSELPVAYQDSVYAGDACQMASNILWAMSGRKYQGTTTVTERYFTAIDAFRYQGSSAKQFFPHMIGGSVFNLPAEDWNDSAYQSDGSSSLSRIRLRGKPVQKVHLVRSGYDGRIIPEDAYYLAEHSTLIANKGTPWTPGNLEITYSFGQQPPTAGRHAARVFAIELIKSWEGDVCALPDRVTSVSRQGVSYTILDNQDFLENFRTGIYLIDLFLKTANPAKALAPSKVFSPDIPRARRAAPARSLVLTADANYDVELKKSNSWIGTKTFVCSGSLASLASYNTAAWELVLVGSSYSGSSTRTYASTAAAFRVVGAVTNIDLSFDYNNTYAAIGHTDPGTWILYAKDVATGATTELLEGNLKIVKVSSDDVSKTGLRQSNYALINCREGQTFSKTIRWRRENALVNLTGFTAAMQVKVSSTSTDALITLTSTTGATRVVSSAVVASNIVTINTSAAHGFAIGDIVNLHNVVSATSDLTYRVKSVPTSTSFTVAHTAANGSLTLGASPTVNVEASIILGGAAGTIVISLSDEVTADLSPATYVYDMELNSSTGDKTRLIQGAFIVDPEVTTT